MHTSADLFTVSSFRKRLQRPMWLVGCQPLKWQRLFIHAFLRITTLHRQIRSDLKFGVLFLHLLLSQIQVVQEAPGRAFFGLPSSQFLRVLGLIPQRIITRINDRWAYGSEFLQIPQRRNGTIPSPFPFSPISTNKISLGNLPSFGSSVTEAPFL
jgi:hypothetical protein